MVNDKPFVRILRIGIPALLVGGLLGAAFFGPLLNPPVQKCPEPSGLRAVDIQPTEITYTWETTALSSGYSVRFFDNQDNVLLIDTVVSQPPFTATGLEPNRAYRIEVQNLCEDIPAATNLEDESCTSSLVVNSADFIIEIVVEYNSPGLQRDTCTFLNTCEVDTSALASSGCFSWQSMGTEWHHIEIRRVPDGQLISRIRIKKEMDWTTSPATMTVTSFNLESCDCLDERATESEEQTRNCVVNPADLDCSTAPCTLVSGAGTLAPPFQISFSESGYCVYFDDGTSLVPATPANLVAFNRSVSIRVCTE